MIGSACLGGGAGRVALRAVTMTAQFLLTVLLDFNSFLPLVVSGSSFIRMSLPLITHLSASSKTFHST